MFVLLSLIKHYPNVIKFVYDDYSFHLLFSLKSSKASSPENDAPDSVLSAQGQSGDKWQYLHHELSSKTRLPPPQPVQPQVSLCAHSIEERVCVFENTISIY